EITFEKLDSPEIINVDAGLLIHKGYTIKWLSYELKTHFEIYLFLNDKGKRPYRNILVCGCGGSIEDAREKSLINLSIRLDP
uniref:hypothetical protein n=1 Tax=Cytobacillus gottheilii TaxID=859144 RepID=UPI002494FD82